MRGVSWFIKRFLAIVLLVLVLLNLWFLAGKVILQQELPSIGGYACLIVLSGSMEPTISAGDVIVIQRQNMYAAGEIITFEDDGALTTHRITAVETEGFGTQGDANNRPDQRITAPEAVKGRVVAVLPHLGQALLFLRRPEGLAMLLLLGGVVLLAAEVCVKKGKGDVR